MLRYADDSLAKRNQAVGHGLPPRGTGYGGVCRSGVNRIMVQTVRRR